MAYSTFTFGEWGVHDFTGADGAAYRLCLEVAGHSAPRFDLGPVSGGQAGGGLTIEQASPSSGAAADLLQPVVVTTATVRVHGLAGGRPHVADGLLSLAALPAGAVRLRLLRNADVPAATVAGKGSHPVSSADAAWSLAYCGYLSSDGLADAPREVLEAAEVRFQDGLSLLLNRPWLGEAPDWDETDGSGDEERLADALWRILLPLVGDPSGPRGLATLRTQSDLYPYVPGDAVTGTTDPVRALRMLRAALYDPETGDEATQAEALRQIAGVLGGRLVQAAGGWTLTSPALLASTRGLSVPTHAYDLVTRSEGDTGTRTTPGVTVRLFDASGDPVDGYRQVRGLRDGVGAPVRECASLYGFAPDLDDLVANGGFEVAGATSATAAYWSGFGEAPPDTSAGYGVVEREPVYLGDAESGDRYLAFIPPLDGENNPAEGARGIEQAALSYLTVPPDAVVTAAFAYRRRSGGAPLSQEPRWRLAVGPHALRTRHASISSVVDNVVRGRDATVPILPLLEADNPDDATVDGTDADAVPGTPVLPKGAVLVWYDDSDTERGTLTLSREARVGDASLVGDLSDTLDIDANGTHYAAVYYFGPADPSGYEDEWLPLGENDTAGLVQREVARRAYARAVDGTTVEGYVSLRFEGHVVSDIANAEEQPYQPPSLTVDDVRVGVSVDGRGADTTGRVAALPAGSHGLTVSLPATSDKAFRLGDGPTPFSRTRLRVSGASGTVRDTSQGDLTGWRHGAWGASVPTAGEGDPLHGVLSKDALRLLAGNVGGGSGSGERRVDLGVLLRPKANGTAPDLLWADRPLVCAVGARVQSYAPAGSDEVALSRPPTPGEFACLDTAGTNGTPETLACADEAPGLRVGGYAVALDSTAHPSGTARAHYPGEEAWVGRLVMPTRLAWDVAAGRYEVSALSLALADPAGFLTMTTLDA